MWGEHMHHGYYPADGAQVSNQQAQIDMIERTLSWAGVDSVHQVRSMPGSLRGEWLAMRWQRRLL